MESTSQTSWLKMVLFSTNDTIVFVFYPVCRLLDCGKYLSMRAAGVPEDSGDVQRRLLLGDLLLQFLAQSVLGILPASSTHFPPPCVPDAGIHRAKQHV